LASAVRRRASYIVRRLGSEGRETAVERAFDWLSEAIAQGEAANIPPEVFCAAGVAAAQLGETELAQVCARRALIAQRADGALCDGTGRAPSLFATAQLVRLVLALDDESSYARRKAELACASILAHIDRAGRLLPDNESNGLADRWASPLARLACLAPVAAAARRWNELAWLRLIERAVWRAQQTVDFAPWTTPSHLWAQAVDAQIVLGHTEAARVQSRWLDLAQREDGSLRLHIDSAGVSARATAHAAGIWYALDQPERGDQALDWLAGRQSSDGGFREDHRPNPAPGSIWTAIHFLHASQAQVQSSFARHEAELPRSIEASDGRYVAVRHWLGDMADDARVLDAGCGSGRFITRLSSESPRLHLIGVDGSRQALDRLPKEVERREGDLLRLPIADGECDAAYMVEALEHALLPRRAIDEMCRSVRPGGRILVIDKCHSRQGLSLYEPWERWFTADEVHAWLATHCDEVSVAPVAHGRHQQPNGLFLCWTARKRALTSEVRSAA